MRTFLILLLLVTRVARASYGDGDSRLEQLYTSFMSPCCWRENLSVHQSPDASRLRARIASMVEDGRSNDSIQQALVGEYGKRILSLPEGQARVALFWTPIAFFGLGAVALGAVLRRMRRSPITASDGLPMSFDPDWDLE